MRVQKKSWKVWEVGYERSGEVIVDSSAWRAVERWADAHHRTKTGRICKREWKVFVQSTDARLTPAWVCLVRGMRRPVGFDIVFVEGPEPFPTPPACRHEVRRVRVVDIEERTGDLTREGGRAREGFRRSDGVW